METNEVLLRIIEKRLEQVVGLLIAQLSTKPPRRAIGGLTGANIKAVGKEIGRLRKMLKGGD